MFNFKDLQILAVLCAILAGAALLAAGLVSRALILGLMPPCEIWVILLFASGAALGGDRVFQDEDTGPVSRNDTFIY